MPDPIKKTPPPPTGRVRIRDEDDGKVYTLPFWGARPSDDALLAKVQQFKDEAAATVPPPPPALKSAPKPAPVPPVASPAAPWTPTGKITRNGEALTLYDNAPATARTGESFDQDGKTYDFVQRDNSNVRNISDVSTEALTSQAIADRAQRIPLRDLINQSGPDARDMTGVPPWNPNDPVQPKEYAFFDQTVDPKTNKVRGTPVDDEGQPITGPGFISSAVSAVKNGINSLGAALSGRDIDTTAGFGMGTSQQNNEAREAMTPLDLGPDTDESGNVRPLTTRPEFQKLEGMDKVRALWEFANRRAASGFSGNTPLKQYDQERGLNPAFTYPTVEHGGEVLGKVSTAGGNFVKGTVAPGLERSAAREPSPDESQTMLGQVPSVLRDVFTDPAGNVGSGLEAAINNDGAERIGRATPSLDPRTLWGFLYNAGVDTALDPLNFVGAGAVGGAGKATRAARGLESVGAAALENLPDDVARLAGRGAVEAEAEAATRAARPIPQPVAPPVADVPVPSPAARAVAPDPVASVRRPAPAAPAVAEPAITYDPDLEAINNLNAYFGGDAKLRDKVLGDYFDRTGQRSKPAPVYRGKVPANVAAKEEAAQAAEAARAKDAFLNAPAQVAKPAPAPLSAAAVESLDELNTLRGARGQSKVNPGEWAKRTPAQQESILEAERDAAPKPVTVEKTNAVEKPEKSLNERGQVEKPEKVEKPSSYAMDDDTPSLDDLNDLLKAQGRKEFTADRWDKLTDKQKQVAYDNLHQNTIKRAQKVLSGEKLQPVKATVKPAPAPVVARPAKVPALVRVVPAQTPKPVTAKVVPPIPAKTSAGAAESAKVVPIPPIPPAKVGATVSPVRRVGRGLSRVLAEANGVARSLQTTADLSASLRQGITLGVTRPKQAGAAYVKGLRAMFSEKAFETAEKELATHPNRAVWDKHNLYRASTGGPLTAREEAFRSNLAERIPAIGPVVKASERAYNTTLNHLRTSTFETQAKVWAKRGITPENSPEAFRSLAEYINSATGRGSLGNFEKAAETLSAVMYSPRLQKSRLDALNPSWWAKLEPNARKVAARDFGAHLVAAGGVLSVAELSGATVDKDLTSSNFGKIKVGPNTWVDPVGAGYLPYLRLMAQLTLKEKNGKPLDRKDIADVLVQFSRTKLAPLPGVAADAYYGETIDKKPFDAGAESLRLVSPFIIKDVYDAYTTDGAGTAALVAPLAVHGAGVNVYQPRDRHGKYSTSDNKETDGGR